MEKMEEGERSGGEEEAELLMVCDEEELEVFPQETKGGDNRDETNKPAAEGSMEDVRIDKVLDQPDSDMHKDTLINSPNNRVKVAPLGFKLNGRLVSLQPGGGAAELKLCSTPRGSASGFTSLQVSIHPRVQQPDVNTVSAQTGAHLTPIITGVVSGEAAQRVFSHNSANFKSPLRENNNQTGASSLTSSNKQQESDQLGPTPPDCLNCRSQYKFISKLRGFMCMCSPAIALSLKTAEKKKRRICQRRIRDKNRIPKSRDPQILRPPGFMNRPGPGPGPSAQDQCGASQGKLVIMVEDFYYGSAPGRRNTNETDDGNCGPYQCNHCQSSLHNNIELMNHTKHHITESQLDRRRDSLTFCSHCLRHFTSPFSLQCHQEAVHTQCTLTALCKICELAFISEATFLSHMKNTHKPGEMPYTCQVCGFRSSFFADVWSHFERIHVDSDHLLCPFCLRVMNSDICYQQHVARHQRKHVFGCELCRLHFLYDKELIQHKEMHHRTYVKPVQLTGLKPGTKVTVRTYAVVEQSENNEALKRSVDPEPASLRRKAMKRKLVESLGEILSTFSQESISDGVSPSSPLCVECLSSIQDFKTHFPSVVRCSMCSFLTCCCTAYANHMISNHAVQTAAPKYTNIFQLQPKLPEKLECVSCSFSTYRGDIMANHLTEKPQHRCATLPNDETTSDESSPDDRTCDELFAPLDTGEESEEFCETFDEDMKPELEADEQNLNIKEETPCDPAYGEMCREEMGEMMQTPDQTLSDEDQKPFSDESQNNLQGLDFDGSSKFLYYHLIDERGQSHNVSNASNSSNSSNAAPVKKKELRPVKRMKTSYTPRVTPSTEQTGIQDSFNPVRLSQIHQHIESFHPTMSHYGRNHDHDQRFLPSDVSLRLMFEDFAANHRTSFKRYQKALTSCSVSFSRPGEEPCDLCLQHQHHMSVRHRDHDWVKNLQEPPPDCSTCSLWEEHRGRMEKAIRCYKRDARTPQSDQLSIRRVDLQRVILLPRIPRFKQALSSRRISAFHETFATVSQRRGSEKKSISVIWHEGVALRKAVEVASAYVCGLQWEWNVPHVVIWLDGSTAQYRNWCLITTLITLVNQNWNRMEDLTLKYFEPGHTFMTTDCFHQRVEREMERRPGGRVLDFQEFRQVVAAAQSGEVVEMRNEDIRMWTEGNSRRKLTNTPPLPELAQIQFRKGSRLLWVKLSHDQDEFTRVDFLRNRTRLIIPGPLRSAEQGVSRRKKMDILMNAARLMPQRNRAFWESLTESAEDDEDDEDEDDDDEEEEEEEEGEDE